MGKYLEDQKTEAETLLAFLEAATLLAKGVERPPPPIRTDGTFEEKYLAFRDWATKFSNQAELASLSAFLSIAFINSANYIRVANAHLENQKSQIESLQKLAERAILSLDAEQAERASIIKQKSALQRHLVTLLGATKKLAQSVTQDMEDYRKEQSRKAKLARKGLSVGDFATRYNERGEVKVMQLYRKLAKEFGLTVRAVQVIKAKAQAQNLLK